MIPNRSIEKSVFITLSFGWLIIGFYYAIESYIPKEVCQIVVSAVIIMLLLNIIARRQIIDVILCVGLCYGLFGGFNFFNRGAHVDYLNEVYFLLSVTALYSGHKLAEIFWNSTSKPYPVTSLESLSNGLSLFDLIILLLGILAMLLDWYQVGTLPILAVEEARYSSAPFFRMLFFLALSWLSYIFCTKNNRLFIKFLTSIYMLLIIGSGYRTDGFYLIGIILLFFFPVFSMSLRSVLKYCLIGLMLFLALNLLKLYRDVTQYGSLTALQEIVESEGLSPDLVWLSPILHTIREGPQMFQQVRNNLTEYGMGYYLIENISTVLPGKQYGYGMQYNLITHAASDKTKVATLPCAFYVDGGWLAIIICLFIMGLFAGMHSVLAKKNKRWYFIYVFVLTHYGIWWHSGIPFQPSSIIVYFVLLFLLNNPFFYKSYSFRMVTVRHSLPRNHQLT